MARRRDLLAGGVSLAAIPSSTLADHGRAGTNIETARSPIMVPTLREAEAGRWPVSQAFISTQGHRSLGDRGGGLWKRVPVEPIHPGKFRDMDGAWWELAVAEATPEMFGVTGRKDDSAELEAALTYIQATGRILRIPSGSRVRLDRALAFPLTGGQVIGEPGSVLDMSLGGSLNLGPGVTRISDLAADIMLGSTEVQFSGAHGLSVDDVFSVWDPREYSQSPYRSYYHAGDVFRVGAVLDRYRVRIYGHSLELFKASHCRIYKLLGGSISLSGVEIMPGSATETLTLDGFVGVRLDGVKAELGSTNTVVDIYRCYDVHVRDLRVTAQGGDAYPVSISNSQKVLIESVTGSYSTRHCLALGGRPGEGGVPTADVTIRGFHAHNLGSGGVPAADIHGGCKRIIYDGCLIYGGGVAGVDVTYRNCTIMGRPHGQFPDGLAFYGGEIVGGTITLENCHIRSHGESADFGTIHLDVSKIRRGLNLIIRNVTLENPSAKASGAVAISLLVGDEVPAEHRIRVSIDGFKCLSSGLAGLMIVRGKNDVSRMLDVNMKNISLPGDALLYLVNSAANYLVDISGPGVDPGVLIAGDADLALDPRQDKDICLFDRPLTADRDISFQAAKAVPGDRFTISRPGSGGFTVNVGRLTALRANEWCTVAYAGPPVEGAFVLVARGSLGAQG